MTETDNNPRVLTADAVKSGLELLGTKKKRIEFLAKTFAPNANRAERRAIAANIRKDMKGIAI